MSFDGWMIVPISRLVRAYIYICMHVCGCNCICECMRIFRIPSAFNFDSRSRSSPPESNWMEDIFSFCRVNVRHVARKSGPVDWIIS